MYSHRKLRRLIGRKNTSRAKRNPAADLGGALPPVPDDNHFPSITEPARVGELLRAIDGYKGNLTTCCALRLAPCTAW